MKTRPTAALAVGALALLAAGLADAAAQDPPRPFRLGVVNLKECFKRENYARMKEVHEEIARVRKDLEGELKDINDEIAKLREKLGGLPKGSELYTATLIQLKALDTKLKATQEYNQYKLRDRSSQLVGDAYNEIRRVVALVGKEQKFDLILRMEEPEVEGEDPASVNQQISSRVVLYTNESVDITPAVIKRLNEEYAKRKK